jgi:hypothetical protein
MPGQNDQSVEIEDPKIVIGKASRGLQHEDLAEEESRLGVKAGEGIALCLSGGGIRSATFSLGVIQTLAKLGWLARFTHLSTVSGGGYIGSWLTSWIRRIKITDVVDALKADGRPEPEEIRRLRASSNYLSPRGGISADLLALVSTFLRNLLINWAILVPLLVVLTMIPLILVGIADEERVYTGWGSGFLRMFFAAMAAIFVTIALAYTATDVPDGNAHQTRTSRYREFVFFPVLVACFLVSLALVDMIVVAQPAEAVSWWRDGDFWLFAGIGAAIHFVGVSIGTYLLRDRRKHFKPANYEPVPKLLGKGAPNWVKPVSLLIFIATSGAFSGAVAYLGMRLARSGYQAVSSHATYAESWSAVYSTLAVPYLLLCFFLGTVLHVALIRRNTDEGAREWWGRSGGTWIMLAVAWVVAHVVCIWVPQLLSQFGASVVGGSGALGGVLVAVIGYYSKHKPDPKQANELDFLERLNIGVLDLLSLAFIVSLVAAICLAAVDVAANLQVADEAIPAQFYGDLNNNAAWKLIALLVAGAVALAISWAAGVNAFSMHAMYGNRLARAYLGATRPDEPDEKARKPHAYTGFDPDDDLPLAESREEPGDETREVLQRPFHVINTALNIVRPSADHLEWQERKAASFTMTPLRTGSRLTGYCRTRQIGGRADVNPESKLPSGLTIGRSMTISGAAAAPNMGYHSSRLVAIVMTFFNVRLGWWMRNPARLFLQPPMNGQKKSYEGLWGKAKEYVHDWKADRAREQRRELISELCHTEPGNPLRALFSELTNDTREDSDYVYLSDGGHFENLGLYEMVRRRCAEIVLVDAGCDPKYEYEDLERATRIIRNDLNADIRIPDLPTADSIEQTGRHYAIGTITYKNVPGQPVGKILYIKPGMSWKEPLDVTRYAKRSRANGEPFPHQSTADQFFDEPQFESYRALGQYSVESLAIAKVATIAGLEAALIEQAEKAKAEGADAPAAPAPAAAEDEEKKSGGGLLEVLSGLFSVDKLPGLVAAVLGTTGVVNYFMPERKETPTTKEAPADAVDDIVAADSPPAAVDDPSEGGKVVLVIPVRGFEEGQLCRSVGKICNDGARLSRGMEEKLHALDRKLASCGPSAATPLTFTVMGFASSSEFAIRRVSSSNESRQVLHPESDRLNLNLADARARVVATHLGLALAINSNKSDDSLSLWLSKSNALDAPTLRQRREDMLDQLDIDTADGAYDRAAGVENRRVEIRFESLGGCQASELNAVMRPEPRRATPTVAAR